MLSLFLISSFAASLTPCERELQSGRYINAIAAEFPALQNGHPCVAPSGPNANIFCFCAPFESLSPIWMICGISIDTDTPSGQERVDIIGERLGNEDDMLPFFLMEDYSHSPLPPIVYAYPGCRPTVYAEIMIFPAGMEESWFDPPSTPNMWPPYDGPPVPPESTVEPKSGMNLKRTKSWPTQTMSITIQRAFSSPARLNYPHKIISLSQCTCGSPNTVCPITIEPFRPGQFVYVLTSDEFMLSTGKSVPCFSAEGLAQLAKRSPGGFKDPLRRTDRSLLIRRDFAAYFVYDDQGCLADELGRMAVNSEGPTSGGKHNSEAGPSADPEEQRVSQKEFPNASRFILCIFILIIVASTCFHFTFFSFSSDETMKYPLL